MDLYLKVTAGVLLSVVLCLVLTKQGKDYTLLLSLAVCAMVMIAASSYLQQLISFFSRLAQMGQLKNELLNLMLKAVGIGLISQIAGMICADAGNQSLGKTLQILSTAVILWISIPLLEEILSLMESVLGAI